MRYATPPLRVISLTIVFLLMLTLSSCIWGVEAPFEESPVDYFGYLEDETPDGLKITGELDSSVSCVLNVENKSYRDYHFSDSYALYRWMDGDWLPVKKLRNVRVDAYYSGVSYSGEETSLIYNWSYEYGELGKGSYKLVISCIEPTSLVSFNFKLPSKPFSNKPEDEYGYLAAGDSEELTMTAQQISPHRFSLTIKSSGRRYYFDRTYALYCKSGDKWQPVEQKISLPAYMYSNAYHSDDGTCTVILTPFYGVLPAGDYRIVKRGLPRGEANWYVRPSSDYSFVAVDFHLEEDLKELEYEHDPYDWFGWQEDSPELDEIETDLTNLSAEGCTINIVNNGEVYYNTGDSGWIFYIYKLVDGEWLPVKQQATPVWPGSETKLSYNGQLSLNLDWQYMYGSLSPGTYRLVKKFTKFGNYIEKNLLKSWEFEITEEMAAEKPDNPYGYTVDSPLLKDAILTLEELDSNRFKLAVIRDGENIGSADLSFALYEEKDGEWLPVPCKYDILKYYYHDEEGSYIFMPGNFQQPTDIIIDLNALYDKLKPGTYRLVKRYLSNINSDKIYYLTADLVYTGY